jgi:PAS domain-containing protein
MMQGLAALLEEGTKKAKHFGGSRSTYSTSSSKSATSTVSTSSGATCISDVSEVEEAWEENPILFQGGLAWLFREGPPRTRQCRYVRRQEGRFDSLLEDVGGEVEWECSDSLGVDDHEEEVSDVVDHGVEFLPLEHPSVEMFALEDLCNLDVAFVIVDPSLVGAPIVACSESFLTLSGYSKREVVGLSLASLQTPETRDGWNQSRYSALCAHEYSMFTAAEVNSDGVAQHEEGELMSQFVGIRKHEGTFRCQALIRQVLFDDEMFVVCVFVEFPEATSGQEGEEVVRKVQCNFSLTVQTLAASFWCDIPFRRQEAMDLND